jgi:hypothetical protein
MNEEKERIEKLLEDNKITFTCVSIDNIEECNFTYIDLINLGLGRILEYKLLEFIERRKRDKKNGPYKLEIKDYKNRIIYPSYIIYDGGEKNE